MNKGMTQYCRLLLNQIAAVALLCASTAALADSGAVDGCKQGSESLGFWQRLSDSYQKHLFPVDQPTPAPDPNAPFDPEAAGYRKDLPPPPVSSPPWPYSVYNEGGTELIGYENMYSSALMDALYCGSNGKALKDSRFVVYGWIEPGGNISTSNLAPAGPIRPVFRAHAGRDPARPHGLGFPRRAALWHRLQVHVRERHLELSVHRTGAALRLRSGDVLPGLLFSELLRRRESASGTLHLDPRHRGPTGAQQHDLQPFVAVHLRSLYADRHRVDHDAQQELESAAGDFRRQRHRPDR